MIANSQKNISEVEKGIRDNNNFIAHFKKYGNFEKVTRPMLVEFVDEIRVREGNKIEINLKFKDAYKQVIECIEPMKRFQRWRKFCKIAVEFYEE